MGWGEGKPEAVKRRKFRHANRGGAGQVAPAKTRAGRFMYYEKWNDGAVSFRRSRALDKTRFMAPSKKLFLSAGGEIVAIKNR